MQEVPAASLYLERRVRRVVLDEQVCRDQAVMHVDETHPAFLHSLNAAVAHVKISATHDIDCGGRAPTIDP